MSFRRPLLLALLLALAPAASADEGHDHEAEGYDPLVLDIETWLAPPGALELVAPEAGAVHFASGDVQGPAPALTFALNAPVTFSPNGGVEAVLQLVADKPVVARDADGNALNVAFLLDGKPVPGAAQKVAFSKPVLAPGDAEQVKVTLSLPGEALPEGASLALQIQPLMPALAEEALRINVGAQASRATFPHARIPTLDDLELQDAPSLIQFKLSNETFAPSDANAALYTVNVRHDAVDVSGTKRATAAKMYVVLRGEETAADAEANHAFPDRERRVAAAHAFRVDDTLVRVHPGMGVVVILTWEGRNLSVPVTCVAHCPVNGWSTTLRFDLPAGANATQPGSVLIPPPRSTTGIPVSEDAPEEKLLVPAPWLAPLAALGAGAWLRRRG